METYQWMNKFIRPRKVEKLRIGNKADGGYVLPVKSVEECKLCVSYGLGRNITFEKDLIRRKIEIIGFDLNVKRHPSWARQLRLKNYDDFSKLTEVFQHKQVILKIDTEGSEWEFFKSLDISHFGEFVSCFAFELHLKMNPQKIPLSVMEKMFDTHYVVHIHGNNYGKMENMVPVSLEITLANKKLYDNPPFDFQKYPIEGLDFRNKSGKPDYPITWLQGIKIL